MSAITFDTLKFAKRLQEAGMQKEQAEELAEAIKEVQSDSANTAATKQDLQILEQKLTIKLGSFIAIGIGIIAALIKL